MNTDLYYGLLRAQQEAYYQSHEFQHRVALAASRRRRPARRHLAAFWRRMAVTVIGPARADRAVVVTPTEGSP